MSNYDFDGGFNRDDFNRDASQRPQQLRNSLTPVTIKQVNDATQPIPDGDFIVNNVELSLISYVAVLRKIDQLNGSVNLQVEDGTGSVEIRKWIDSNKTTVEAEAEKYAAYLDQYVFVTAALKFQNDKKIMQNASIRPVTDHNEVLYHNLAAISHHVKAQGVTAKLESDGNSLFVQDNALDSVEDRIFAFISDNSGTMQEGVPVSLISQNLSLSNDVVNQKCNDLVELGKIYSGYDDASFLCI